MSVSHGDALFPELLGKVVGVEDEFPWALDGAKESDLWAVQDGRVAFAAYSGGVFHGSLALLEAFLSGRGDFPGAVGGVVLE